FNLLLCSTLWFFGCSGSTPIPEADKGSIYYCAIPASTGDLAKNNGFVPLDVNKLSSWCRRLNGSDENFLFQKTCKAGVFGSVDCAKLKAVEGYGAQVWSIRASDSKSISDCAMQGTLLGPGKLQCASVANDGNCVAWDTFYGCIYRGDITLCDAS